MKAVFSAVLAGLCTYFVLMSIFSLIFSDEPQQEKPLTFEDLQKCVVTDIIDTTTVIVNLDEFPRIVRLANVMVSEDAASEGSNTIVDYLETYLLNQTVFLEFDPQKDGQQPLVYVYLEDGEMFNKMLLAQGYVQFDGLAEKHHDELKRIQENSQSPSAAA